MSRFLIVLLLITNTSLAQINLNQGLVAYYPFSGNGNDASGNNINGSLSNVTITSDRSGTPNSAYYFNGLNAYILLPFSNLYNFAAQDSFSISAWVLPDQGNNSWPAQAVVVKSPTHSDFTLSLWNYGIYIFSYKAMSGYAYNHILNSSTTLTNTQCWYNIISTYNNGEWNLYINGILESSDLSHSKFILQDATSKIAIGKKGESFGDYYKGKMDEVRIYNRVLNKAEIDSLSYNGQPIKAINDTTLCDGTSIQLNASGSNAYSWFPSTGLSNPNISNPVATPSGTTQYFVTGINNFGCISKDSLTITVNPKPIITITNDTLLCNNTTLQLHAGGGTSYTWSPAASLTNNLIPNPVAAPAANTKYYVTVKDANNCSNTDSVQVDVRSANNFLISPAVDICRNDSIQISASGGDTYSWNNAATLTNASVANPFASPQTTTSYAVLITDTVCHNTTTLSTTVTVLPLPVLFLTKSNDIDCSIDQSRLTVSGAAIYSWLPAGTLNNPAVYNPIASPTATTNYVVTGTDLDGCMNTDSITVLVNADNKGGYLMPNAFTPNNDGLNDCYGTRYWGIILEIEFSIFNRWGERVFYTTDPAKCWDGNYKGIQQNPGVFSYMIKAKTSCESYVFRKGTFLLMR